MSTFPAEKSVSFKEFVLLMASLSALTAMSIDTILPALPMLGKDLHIPGANHAQYVISFLFGGFTLGQIIYGPISDSLGRKKTMYAGLIIFLLGSFLCLTATSFTMMLIGRFLQGFGVASPRIISIAVTRDLYEGREMAKVMSYTMGIFILVPALAPTVGQAIILAANWRMIFVIFLLFASAVMLWMHVRLPETLPVSHRRPFGFRPIWDGAKTVLRNPITMGYTICSGFIFAALTGYVCSAQQIFQDHFKVGEWFPLFFAISALSIGAASIFNSTIVMRFGMQRICHYSLMGMIVSSSLFLIISMLQDYHAPLWQFMIYCPFTFFCVGLLFGNFNAIAMEPMGELAGIASAIIGFLSSAISVVVGTVIGQAYNGTLIPIVSGFLCLTLAAFILQHSLNRLPKVRVTA